MMTLIRSQYVWDGYTLGAPILDVRIILTPVDKLLLPTAAEYDPIMNKIRKELVATSRIYVALPIS
jgi:hypothetical protein